MARADTFTNNRSLAIIAGGVLIALLYFASEVLIPLALAVLVSFLLAPLVRRLERLKLGRVAAVIVVTGLSFVVLGTLAWVVTVQVIDLADQLPRYRENIRAKAAVLRGDGHGTLDKLKEIGKEIAVTQPTTQEAGSLGGSLTSAQSHMPIPVELRQPEPSPIAALQTTLGPLLGPLGTMGIVIVFVIFILLGREDLRDRLIRLVGHGQLNLTTQALDDAASRISRYLLMQLIVNATYGIPVAVGLFFLGVPNAVLWGLLATVLRFIPYIGPWIAASMPIALSLAVFEGWTHPLMVIGLFVVLELVSNNVMEPWLYGTSTGMSSVAILVAAVFWTWLWGAAGLLLSTPLTVCLVVIGKYVPQLGFLNVLLGDEPVLAPHMRIYQRLLAMDSEEAADLVEEAAAEQSLVEVYDGMLVPALRLAEQDRHRGRLDDDRWKFIRQSMRDIVADLGESAGIEDLRAQTRAESDGKAENGQKGGKESRPYVLVLPARDEADEIVSVMLAQVLHKAGAPAHYVPTEALANEMVEVAERLAPQVVCVSALPPAAATHARYLCKLLKKRESKAVLAIGLWTASAELKALQGRLRCDEQDVIVTTLKEAVAKIQPLVQTVKVVEEAAEPQRVAAAAVAAAEAEATYPGEEALVRETPAIKAARQGQAPTPPDPAHRG